MSGFVYMWINKTNNKKYIGSHIGNINDGYIGSGKAFRQAIEKYGIDNFERIILENVELKENVQKREQYYLDLFNVANDRNFYNMRSTTGGGWEYVNSNETYKAQNIERLKDRWNHLPHPKGFQNKKHTNESKKQTSMTVKKSFIEKGICKPVIQMDLDGNFIKRYDSITDAAKQVRGNPSNIKYTIEGKFSKAYNHKWKYDI